MIEDLADYVGHETPSNDTALLRVRLAWIEQWLHPRLGVSVQRGGH